ncbi:MAG: hypothetical protein RL129_335 [Actinomycetota bacterium]|jgi:tight adherence protein B
MKMDRENVKRISLVSIGILFGTLTGFILTSSLIIGISFGAISSIAPQIYLQRKTEKIRNSLQKLWPEILDHLISGLNSGLSLTQTIVTLGHRGPQATRGIFQDFEIEIKTGTNYNVAIKRIKDSFKDPIADQVCEVLDFAKSSGSRDSALTLRTLSSYIRSDLALRNEISAKHGWIKNAAILAGLAPWLLLIILSTQESTVKAYSNFAGVLILATGVALTLVAFFWMEKVGRIPTQPRVFIKNLGNEISQR